MSNISEGANGTFGQLERVELRDYWPDEAADFTPWLAQPEAERSSLLGEESSVQ